MIENELRSALIDVQASELRYSRKLGKAKTENEKERIKTKMTYLSGREQGILDAIQILWGKGCNINID